MRFWDKFPWEAVSFTVDCFQDVIQTSVKADIRILDPALRQKIGPDNILKSLPVIIFSRDSMPLCLWLVIYCLIFFCSSFAILNLFRSETRGWNFLLQPSPTCPRLVHQFEFLFNSLPTALAETDFFNRVHTNLWELRSWVKKSLYAYLNQPFLILSPVFYFPSFHFQL